MIITEAKLKRLLGELKIILGDEDFYNANELISYGEYGIAIELICVQLFEYDKAINSGVRDEILNFIVDMELDPELINGIRVIDK